jgi:hypothetical protein
VHRSEAKFKNPTLPFFGQRKIISENMPMAHTGLEDSKEPVHRSC